MAKWLALDGPDRVDEAMPASDFVKPIVKDASRIKYGTKAWNNFSPAFNNK